eukprot:3273006-Pyramimonas_sp.AAC.1
MAPPKSPFGPWPTPSVPSLLYSCVGDASPCHPANFLPSSIGPIALTNANALYVPPPPPHHHPPPFARILPPTHPPAAAHDIFEHAH